MCMLLLMILLRGVIMLRHIVAWDWKDGLTDEEKRTHAQTIKSELEVLPRCISEIVRLTVHIDLLSSSDRDIVLDSLFESEAALAAYQVHPEHQRVAGLVKAVTQNRVCLDYFE